MTEKERDQLLKQIKRELKKWHVAGVARDTGLTYPTVQSIADGEDRRRHDDTIEKLAIYFGLIEVDEV